MNQKDLIKYGLILLGAYLVYRYVQDHGGIDGLFGTPVLAAAGPHPVPVHAPGATGAAVTQPTQPANQTQQIPVLDMTGLVVEPDVNDSLSGTVKINGIPIRLSIITTDGRIFDGTGTDVTARLQGQGVDVAALRGAFENAASGLSGVVQSGWSPAWTM